MPTSKKLIIIGVIAVVVTLVLFFIDSDPMYPGFSGVLKTIFECIMMAALIFLILAINFFALSFFVKKIAQLIKPSARS